MNTGERIKEARKKKGLSQQELAEKLGYRDKSAISKIECGRDIPKNILTALSKVLDVSPMYLMGWDEELISEESESMELLLKFKKLSEEDKNTVSKIIDSLLK